MADGLYLHALTIKDAIDERYLVTFSSNSNATYPIEETTTFQDWYDSVFSNPEYNIVIVSVEALGLMPAYTAVGCGFIACGKYTNESGTPICYITHPASGRWYTMSDGGDPDNILLVSDIIIEG